MSCANTESTAPWNFVAAKCQSDQCQKGNYQFGWLNCHPESSEYFRKKKAVKKAVKNFRVFFFADHFSSFPRGYNRY